jgi:hypothetical protein
MWAGRRLLPRQLLLSQFGAQALGQLASVARKPATYNMLIKPEAKA